MPRGGSAGAGWNQQGPAQTLLDSPPRGHSCCQNLAMGTHYVFSFFFLHGAFSSLYVCEFIPNKCVSAQESGLCRNSEVRANAPIEQPFRKIPLGEVFNSAACQLGKRGKKRGANLRVMLSSHSMLCPCVINPEDNSNDFKKLVYFNRMYQVRCVAFVTALM